MRQIDFWFSIGSTYTYLAAMRLQDAEQESGLRFNWRPSRVRVLMQEMSNIPFKGKPAKEKYMWRDLERRAAGYRIPIELPVRYPLENFDRAKRIAIIGEQEGWCRDYVRSACKLWMQEGIPAGSYSGAMTGSTMRLHSSLDVFPCNLLV